MELTHDVRQPFSGNAEWLLLLVLRKNIGGEIIELLLCLSGELIGGCFISAGDDAASFGMRPMLCGYEYTCACLLVSAAIVEADAHFGVAR